MAYNQFLLTIQKSLNKKSTKSLQKRLFIANRTDGYPPVCSQSPYFKWSGRRDSNSRPTVPKTVALPGCATPRSLRFITLITKLEVFFGLLPLVSFRTYQLKNKPISARLVLKMEVKLEYLYSIFSIDFIRD